MRIEHDIKLGFKDVMIRPKRSTLKSRSEVSLDRELTFLNSKAEWKGIPIMAANMDTVGTFEMALALYIVLISYKYNKPILTRVKHDNGYQGLLLQESSKKL